MGRGRRVTPGIDRENKAMPLVKDVLALSAKAGLIGAALIFPGTAVVVSPIVRYLRDKQDNKEEILNHKFDKVRLWVLLRRLEKQKDVVLKKLPDSQIQVDLTEKGKIKHLKYRVDDMGRTFTKKQWDGKWRIVIFDVPEKFRASRDRLRATLQNLKFYQLQKSTYLTPYPCDEELEYLRQYYQLGDNVQILVTNSLENDQAYRLYFGLIS